MPIRAHRRSWKATENAVFLATLDQKGPFVGYTTQGTAIAIRGNARDQLPPLFILHPTEPAGLRVHPQASTPGAVIEDANDGEGSESLTWFPAGGSPVTIDFARPNAQKQLANLVMGIATPGPILGGDMVFRPTICTCDDCPDQDGCSVPPPPPPPTDTTLIGEFTMHFCDQLCFTALEIRLTAVYRTSAGVEIGRGVYKRGSVNPHVRYTVEAPIIFQRIQEATGQYMQMNLVEEDGFGSNDDWCGDVNVTAAENGQWVSWSNNFGCQSQTDDTGCGGGSACNQPPDPHSAYVWFHWTRKY